MFLTAEYYKKMNRTWLVLDCNFLCHRTKHIMRSLSYGDSPTGVMFGFLKDVPTFCELFNTPHLVFCWDSKTNKRLDIFKQYKANRHPKKDTRTRAELLFESEFRIQMSRLRR